MTGNNKKVTTKSKGKSVAEKHHLSKKITRRILVQTLFVFIVWNLVDNPLNVIFYIESPFLPDNLVDKHGTLEKKR
ncbi:MAG: hypothetical protein ACXAEU_08835 [Candidatus Hodarchaeales archaeon]|jgi:hypothetical protein